MYPSGAWRGYWEQTGWGRQPMHDLVLRFADGQINGSGHDVVGRFTVRGTYDADGAVTLVKYYPSHEVLYRGTHDGEGTIHGRWTIDPHWSGPFALRADYRVEPDAPILTIAAPKDGGS